MTVQPSGLPPCRILAAVLVSILLLPVPRVEARATSFTPDQSLACGDCTGDGRVDILDSLRAAQDLLTRSATTPILLTGRARFACDINSDRRIDMIDVMRIAQHEFLRHSGDAAADQLPCSIIAANMPVAIVGIYYSYDFTDEEIPPGADVQVHGELPIGLSYKPDLRQVSGVPLGAGLCSVDLDIFPGQPGELPQVSRQLALDLEVTSVAHPIDLGYDRQSDDALVATTTLAIPGHGTGAQQYRALAVAPTSWREAPAPVLLLVGIANTVKAVLMTGRAPGSAPTTMLLSLSTTRFGHPVTGIAFAGSVAYAVDSGGALYRITRGSAGTHELQWIASLEEIVGASSLTLDPGIDEAGANPALIVTVASPGEERPRQVVRIPLSILTLPGDQADDPAEAGAPDEVAPPAAQIQVLHGTSGSAFAAAFGRGQAGGPASLYVRRQPDELAVFSFEAGSHAPRFVLPSGSLPPVGGRDSMVATTEGTSLVLSVGNLLDDEDPSASTGVWILPLDGTYRLEQLLYGFVSSEPAGAMAIGASSLGTGQSLFVAGNGKIYEVFGKNGSQGFGF